MNLLEKIKSIPDAYSGLLFSDPYRNGEYRFLKKYIQKSMVIFDVGAHVGEYSGFILNIIDEVEIHCFEPVFETYKALENNLLNKFGKARIYLNNCGLSDIEQEVNIHIYGVKAGTNSLYFNTRFTNSSNEKIMEKIKLITLDNYIIENKINIIHWLKIDVEGNEYNVLNGAKDVLNSNVIRALQFEYNIFWKYANFQLEYAMDLLFSNGYTIYRLTPWGKIPTKKFSKKLENFKHSNYVALKK